jgi:MFS family permease
LSKIQPGDIDHNAARGLEISKSGNEQFQDKPNFNLGIGLNNNVNDGGNDGSTPSAGISDSDSKANSPRQILSDPTLLIFICICFTFHLSNGTVLPLVMQTLAIANGRAGILMSGFCIIVAQIFMVASAHICGKYSGMYGRKRLFLLGILSVPVRCALLALLLHIRGVNGESAVLDIIILSTQILDGVGAGIFGTMYVLVTSDISGGTGRFSLTLGLTTAAMSIGGTVSGYLGQALAEDIGYRQAFVILGCMSLIPAVLYLFFMPETLSEIESAKNNAPAGEMNGIAEEEEGQATAPYGRLT